MDAITAEGLVKIYKTRKSVVRALDGIDLSVPEGTVLGLRGPNGASLPMSRSAVLTGRTFSDVIYNAGILVVLMATGFVVGWRDESISSLVAGFALLLFFAYGMAWLGVWLGLMVPTVEVAQQVIFTVLFPITFISNVFVPGSSLPDWLQPVAEWNPTSTLTAALRELWGNSTEPALVTIVWVIIFIVVVAPLGTRRYRSMSR